MAWIRTNGQVRTEMKENASSYISMRLRKCDSRQVGIKSGLFLVSFIARAEKKQQHRKQHAVLVRMLSTENQMDFVLYPTLHALTTTRVA